MIKLNNKFQSIIKTIFTVSLYPPKDIPPVSFLRYPKKFFRTINKPIT